MTEFEEQVLKALENLQERLEEVERATFPFSHQNANRPLQSFSEIVFGGAPAIDPDGLCTSGYGQVNTCGDEGSET